MDNTATNLISEIWYSLNHLFPEISPDLKQWQQAVTQETEGLDPLQRQGYLEQKLEAIPTPDAGASNFCAIIEQVFDPGIVEGRQIDEDHPLVIAADVIISEHQALREIKAEYLAPRFLELLKATMLAQEQQREIKRLLSENEKPLWEYRMKRAENATLAASKESKRGKGKGKSEYTDRRQALLGYYTLLTWEVQMEYVNKADVARLLHGYAGYGPEVKDGKEDLDGSSIYQAVKNMFSKNDANQIEDHEFALSLFRPFKTPEPAEGQLPSRINQIIAAIEQHLNSIRQTRSKGR